MFFSYNNLKVFDRLYCYYGNLLRHDNDNNLFNSNLCMLSFSSILE